MSVEVGVHLEDRSVRELLMLANQLLPRSETAALDLEVLLLSELQKERSFLYAYPDYVPSERELEGFQLKLFRRQQGEPIAYITCEQEFWSLSLKVNRSVLIPRPETELLVELGLEALESHFKDGRWESPTVVDVGTGSGAIAVAIATAFAHADVIGLDISESALEVAKENAKRYQLDALELRQSDLLTVFPAVPKFHLIVSNPPYLASDDQHLEKGDVRFEPQLALVAERDGLELIERLILQAKERLVPGGFIMIEHGFQQGSLVRERLLKGGFEEVKTESDLAGLDRVSTGCWRG